MNAILLAIEPNDLEILMIEAESLDEIYHATSIRSKLNLGETWQVLHALLTKDLDQQHALQFAIEAEYAFSHPSLSVAHVRYNPVIEVDEIAKALEQISMDNFKHRYDPAWLNQHKLFPFQWGKDVDKEQRELLMLFGQLKNFYELAKQHNHAVISLQSKQIMSDVYYMTQASSN
ncbi:YfbM family protein [Acinetobacter ursingii]|uniref:YfbM family protein n=1 Tax=Acinetobacter ursingii TaxID=108980 RepID=UPI001D69576F|nr:YfbM family protein [Acinetobacter ursingii]MCU4358170.1 YfbM family protein [Acinetobacter ursingii]MEC8057143.1 YfbM family protein [Pseudomonadota bacterium]NOZ97034.1 DUF1877 family protein [Gammaproteobacteria bacterium]